MDHELATSTCPVPRQKPLQEGCDDLRKDTQCVLHTSTQITRSWISFKRWLTPYHLVFETLLWHIVQKHEKLGIFHIYHWWQTYLLSNPWQPHLLTCDVDVDVDVGVDFDVDVDHDAVDSDEDGKRTPPTDPSHPQTAGSLKDFLLRPHPLPAAYLNYPKLHLSQFWNYFVTFIFLDSLQKYLKLLSHFWVADVPNAIVRQATEE